MLLYTSMAPDFVYTSMAQKKKVRASFKSIFEKIFKFRTKVENFRTLIILKIGWLASWFIFEL